MLLDCGSRVCLRFVCLSQAIPKVSKGVCVWVCLGSSGMDLCIDTWLGWAMWLCVCVVLKFCGFSLLGDSWESCKAGSETPRHKDAETQSPRPKGTKTQRHKTQDTRRRHTTTRSTCVIVDIVTTLTTHWHHYYPLLSVIIHYHPLLSISIPPTLMGLFLAEGKWAFWPAFKNHFGDFAGDGIPP